MDVLFQILIILAAFLVFLSSILSIILFTRLSWPAPVLWILKLYVSAISPVLILVGFIVIAVGLLTGSIAIGLIGLYVFVIYSIHLFRVTNPPDVSCGFDHAFGSQWEERISSGQKKHFLRSRRILLLPAVPESLMDQNIPFSTIPGSDRKLLCDVWQPLDSVKRSGLAFIYLHGAAWYFLDKDLGTRPFFSHLAAQGHLIMDVAYRLAPETDIMGMVHDVNRAIVWMKGNAIKYGINVNKIILGGGSSGAHLALLAAYTRGNPEFTPNELKGKDTGVCAVISFYGPADLANMYYHTNQHLTTRSVPGIPKKPVPSKMPDWIVKAMGKDYYRLGMNKGFENAGAFAPLLGGHPDECPDRYDLYSPINHVHSNCPPTLLIHGEHDIMAPVNDTRKLFASLTEKKVKSVMHILPQTDHAFDLQLPKLSPSAHAAMYDVERFMGLQLNFP